MRSLAHTAPASDARGKLRAAHFLRTRLCSYRPNLLASTYSVGRTREPRFSVPVQGKYIPLAPPRQLWFSETPNCVRRQELCIFHQFPPSLVSRVLAKSLMASLSSRAARQLEILALHQATGPGPPSGGADRRCDGDACLRVAPGAPGFLVGAHPPRPAPAVHTRRPCPSAGIGPGRRSGAWGQDGSQARRHGRGQPGGRKQCEVLETTPYGHRVAGTSVGPTCRDGAGRGGPSGRRPPPPRRTPGGVRTQTLPHSPFGIRVLRGRFSPREPAARRDRVNTEGRLPHKSTPVPPTPPRSGLAFASPRPALSRRLAWIGFSIGTGAAAHSTGSPAVLRFRRACA